VRETNDRGLNNTMANVYFSSSLNRQGALRAVLSSEEGVSLLEKFSNSYAGHDFPNEFHGRPEFAILRLLDGEANKEWRAGYYLLDQEIMQVEEAVQSYNRGAS
jgi:hypothetical protein